MKNKLNSDIIVYRKEKNLKYLEGEIGKFLSTSVTQKGVFDGKPNVAIIIPRSVNGAYIETISEKQNQREFLLGVSVKLRKLVEYEESIICEVIVDGV